MTVKTYVFMCCRCTCLTVPIPATVDHHSDEVVHAVEVDGVSRGVEEAELQWKDHTIAQFSVPMELLHVLKALQMKSQDHGQLLHTHTATYMTHIVVCHSVTLVTWITTLYQHTSDTMMLTVSEPLVCYSTSHSSIYTHCTGSLYYWSPCKSNQTKHIYQRA